MGRGYDDLGSSDSTVQISNNNNNNNNNVPSGRRPAGVLLDTSISNLIRKWRQSYRKLVRRHRVSLELLDEGICKLLFWLPHSENDSSSSSSSSAWREIVFGLLSINRLSMHVSQLDVLDNSYGTTVGIDDPDIPATSIRIVLSVIHCLMPSLLGMVQDDPSAPERRQTYLRFSLERLKFVLRLFLLGSYWKQSLQRRRNCGGELQNVSSSSSSSSTSNNLLVGILSDGGMFYENQSQGISEEQANNYERRRNYVGRRTGLQLITEEDTTTKSSSTSSASTNPSKTILAELLYSLRPLYWAYSEHRHHRAVEYETTHGRPTLSLLKAWLTTFTMDVVSLRLLLSSQGNHQWSQEELSRRRMKLLLYLLRSPIWSNVTSPILLSKSSEMIRNIPLLGSIIDSFLWDWVLYHKQAFVSEEG